MYPTHRLAIVNDDTAPMLGSIILNLLLSTVDNSQHVNRWQTLQGSAPHVDATTLTILSNYTVRCKGFKSHDNNQLACQLAHQLVVYDNLCIVTIRIASESVSTCVHAGSVRGMFTSTVTTTSKNSNCMFWWAGISTVAKQNKLLDWMW